MAWGCSRSLRITEADMGHSSDVGHRSDMGLDLNLNSMLQTASTRHDSSVHLQDQMVVDSNVRGVRTHELLLTTTSQEGRSVTGRRYDLQPSLS